MTTYADLLAYRPKPVPADYGWIGALLRGAFDVDAQVTEFPNPATQANLLRQRDMFLSKARQEAGRRE